MDECGRRLEVRGWRRKAVSFIIVFSLLVVAFFACKGCANVTFAEESDPYRAVYGLPAEKWEVWQPKPGYVVLWVGKDAKEKRLLLDAIETEERRVYFTMYPGYLSIHSEDLWHDSLGRTYIYQEFYRDDQYDGIIDHVIRKIVILDKEGMLQNFWDPTFEGSYEIPDTPCINHLDLIEEIVRWNTGKAT